MTSISRRPDVLIRVPLLVSAALIALIMAASLVAPAEAAELKLKCAGPGKRNMDSAGTVLCAADAGHARKVAGTVRNDAGQPVAAKLTLTRSTWTPAPGGGYHIKPTSTTQMTAKADGTFSVKSSPRGRERLRFDLLADPTLGVAASASAEAEVLRRLVVKVAKPGQGKVRLTIKGTKHRPLKVYITDSSGYEVPGVKPKKANRHGKVTFNLGATRSGVFSYYVDAGVYTDLFWAERRKTFKLKNGK